MRLHPRFGITPMNRALPVVLALILAASPTPAFAQEVVPAPSRPLFTQEALRRAASAAMRDTAVPGPPISTPATASAPSPNRSWATLVDTVKKGRKLTLTLMTMTNVEGKLVAIDGQSIRIEQPGGAQTIEAAEVFRVRYAGIRSRHAKWGMLIGASAMAIVGAIAYEPTTHTESDGSTHTQNQAIGAALFSALFFGLPYGAIAGAVMPIGPPLYEAAAVAR